MNSTSAAEVKTQAVAPVYPCVLRVTLVGEGAAAT